MLRLKDPQLTLWDALLPSDLVQLNPELARVDELLEDDKFMTPFISRFEARLGRPTIPMETYLRLMYLKHRYGLGYEVLVQEVNDSIKWRRFCRIPLTQKVPHATTLIKLTKRCGPGVVEELNKALVQEAREKKIIRGKKLQVDTTVVEANIHHPTDAGLLADGVRVITRTVKKIQEAGLAIAGTFHNRQRSIKKRIYAINKVLKRRSNEAYQEVRKITGAILKTTRKVITEAASIVREAKDTLQQQGDQIKGKIHALVQTLEETISRTEKIVTQTAAVQEGNLHLPDRMVSIFDPDARPIKKGKANAPVEFGYKVLLQEVEHKIITGYEVLRGNPADDTLLLGAVEDHIETFNHPPRALAADRGFGGSGNESGCHQLGVKQVSLPRKGKISKARKAYQSQSWFKRLQRWRAGGEATISLLKRKYGLRRSLSRGYEGTTTWVGYGILAYNLHRLATMV
ncbi:ISNCY family transposase ISMomu1 [Moorella humiferrea]|uniref:ISNCY family transposase n=1 Tax=Neomoorella humiferrea TaxID=676965 RepID=UPI0030D499A2